MSFGILGIPIFVWSLKRVTVLLPLDTHKLLKIRGFEQDISMNDQILEAVKMYLQNDSNADIKTD